MEMRKREVMLLRKQTGSVTGQQIASWRTSSRMAGGEGGFRESSENLEEHALAWPVSERKGEEKRGKVVLF